MPHRQMNELRKLGEDHQEPRQYQDLLEAEVFWAMEEDVLSVSSSSSSSPSVVFPDSPEEVAAAVVPSLPQNPPGACPSPEATEALPLSEIQGAGSSSQVEEQQSTMEDLDESESSLRRAVNLKMSELVKFLLQKYRAKELTTKAEMLSSVIKEYEDDFTEILRQASLCMQRVFGIDVKEVDPSDHSYVLVNSLGLTYDGMGSDGRRMPKNGLLVMLLFVILMEGDSVPEEKVWEALNDIQVHDGVEHSIYGEPRELITKVWVQEQYVEYRQVANSDPARYEFLWGPRAYAETTKLKVLQFLFRVSSMDTRPIPFQSEEDESDEEERA
ncbi:melanoma-associated antigen 10-like [Rhinolophus ferrumequinum]|uniref:melanoma-associated antigen 10-like n=1 Tax=Rhinolophus ferrumequinum TaxID=59479 RepID=UPI00140FCD5E|nr:melanoma-associated antigen 10-like [Rhinolophus ferrumequinum]